MTQAALFPEIEAAPGEAARLPCDTALCILVAAAQRPGREAVPFPAHLTGDTTRAAEQLLRRGWIEERPARPYGPAWRHPRGRDPLTLVATDAGLEALNLEPET